MVVDIVRPLVKNAAWTSDYPGIKIVKTRAQLEDSIGRFRRCFWEKQRGGRPPVAVVDGNVYLPIKYLRRPLAGPEVRPQDLTADLAATEYEACFTRPLVGVDDGLPFSAAWRAIPWLEAWCGCPVRYSAGEVAPERFVGSEAELARLPLPAGGEWFECLQHQTARLAAALPEDCWLSPTILRGPSDVLGVMRGLSNFFCDVCDDPAGVGRAAARVNALLIRALKAHFAAVPPKLGGYSHIFGYWAPGPTVVVQDDALGMCAPRVYHELFQSLTAEVVRAIGPYVLFHLHSTGCRHWRHVLEVEGLAGLELTLESKGPTAADLLPLMRETLERSRLILFVDHGFDELGPLLKKLPREGLFLVIPDRYLRSDDEYRQFIAAHW